MARLNAHDVAKMFIYNNPSLANGSFDGNAALNKLLYFSNLMYYCVTGNILLDAEFEAWEKGPVVRNIYKDYRYNGLDRMPQNAVVISGMTPIQEKVLNIINFVYADKDSQSLIDESHTHRLWKDLKHLIPNNPVIDFTKTDAGLCKTFRELYDCYKDFDFTSIKKEIINGNVFYHSADLPITDALLDKLSSVGKLSEPAFVELIDGELVIS